MTTAEIMVVAINLIVLVVVGVMIGAIIYLLKKIADKL